MAFKSVINEYYARDISIKIRSSRRVQAQKGEFYGSNAPYGYSRSPEDKHKLIVDWEAAAVVKNIFQMKADGLGNYQIAKALNAKNIPSPITYRNIKRDHISFEDDGQNSKEWQSASVANILRNRAYAGDMVGHKHSVKSFKIHKTIEIPESEWIVAEQTHEPIIEHDLFEEIQRLIKIKHRENKTFGKNIFAGLLYCADCGYHLSYHTSPRTIGRAGRFECGKYVHSSAYSRDRARCTIHSIPYKSLYELMLTLLNLLMSANLTAEEVTKALQGRINNNRHIPKRLYILKRRNRELKIIVQKIVEQNALGEITKDTFSDLYRKYSAEQERTSSEVNKLEAEISREERGRQNAGLSMEISGKYTTCESLNREVLLDLIEKIVVREPTGDRKAGTRRQRLDVHLRFIGKA